MAAKLGLFALLSFALTPIMDGQTLEGPDHGKVVVCYVATWAAYRTPWSFELSHIDPSLCTHLIYSFAGLDEHTFTIKSLDAWQDLEKDYGKDGYRRMVALKERYPHLKVSIAIGGWNEGSTKYSTMAADPDKRATFVKSVIEFLKLFKFDGLDLDWEYPARRGGLQDDKQNFVSLVNELSDAFQPHGFILTAALGVGKDTMDAAYDLPKLSRYLHFIHMMCYDYHGTWDGVFGANAPLHGANEKDTSSLEFTIKYMLSNGVSPYKMVMGLPMYGRTFLLTEPDAEEVFFGRSKVKPQGFQGPYTKENGFMGYNEICTELTNTSSEWREYWHEPSSTPYLRDGERLVSYDNGRSIALKVKMAIDYGLGGLMVWSIDTDDFLGHCATEKDIYRDYLDRHRAMKRDPIMNTVLERLHLPNGTRRALLNKRSTYVIENGEFELRLPERENSNYNLMRTINEAISMSIEEKRINDEIEKLIMENEIPKGEVKKSNGAGAMRMSIFYILSIFGILLLL